MAASRLKLANELQELIAALDRRTFHLERAGEASIARDAAALREKALKCLADLDAGEQSRKAVTPKGS